MTYSIETVRGVLAYVDEGNTLRAAAHKFNIGVETVAKWRRDRASQANALNTKTLGYSFNEVCSSLMNDDLPVQIKAVLGGLMGKQTNEFSGIEHYDDAEIAKMSEKELLEYVRDLQLENAVLSGTLKILKAEGIGKMTNSEKTILVDALANKFSIQKVLKAVKLSSSSYYYCKNKPIKADKYKQARLAIQEEFSLVGGTRGYRYIRERLRKREKPLYLAGKTVRKLMSQTGCVVSYGRKTRRYSSYAGEIDTAPANLVQRNFHADLPNKLWLTDITEFKVDNKKAYLSVLIDCFDGYPVSWTIGPRPDAELANSMLRQACNGLSSTEHPICHSDRGAHYRWDGWRKICEDNGLIRSMSAKGSSPDNAACEGFFGRLKNEFYYPRDWRGTSIESFMEQLDGYMRYYRDDRIKESLGWMSPTEYRKTLGLVA